MQREEKTSLDKILLADQKIEDVIVEGPESADEAEEQKEEN